MKIVYFDCFSGISGDMILGALLDVGLKKEDLEKELSKLNLSGYRLEVKKIAKRGLAATQVKVEIEEKGVERKLRDIINGIENSKLEEEDKKQIKKIFYKIGEAEAKIHQKDIKDIHFHEIGGLDSIIDITSAVVGIRILGIKEVYSSALPLGNGFVKCAHGNIPVPAPATLEVLKGVPVYSGGIKSEMVTPTGAGIVSSFAKKFGDMPLMKVERIGYGSGEKDFAIPNILRINIGEKILKDENIADDYIYDEVMLIEANIDDMNPEFYNYISDRLFSQGALDVYLTPIQMKKNRPAHMLGIMIYEKNIEEILKILFDESTTLGVRIRKVRRLRLKQQSFISETKYGKIGVKVGILRGEIKNIAPEYEDCRKIAQQYQVPLKVIYDEAKNIAYDKLL